MSNRQLEEFTPTQAFAAEKDGPSFWTFLVEVRPCAICKTPSIHDIPRGPFPAYYHVSFGAQLRRAGLRLVHHHDQNGHPVCTVCTNAGLSRIRCALCEQERSSSEIKESFGDPSEYLCTVCYESTPAKKWDEEVKRLEDKHQYDFT